MINWSWNFSKWEISWKLKQKNSSLFIKVWNQRWTDRSYFWNFKIKRCKILRTQVCWIQFWRVIDLLKTLNFYSHQILLIRKTNQSMKHFQLKVLKIPDGLKKNLWHINFSRLNKMKKITIDILMKTITLAFQKIILLSRLKTKKSNW